MKLYLRTPSMLQHLMNVDLDSFLAGASVTGNMNIAEHSNNGQFFTVLKYKNGKIFNTLLIGCIHLQFYIQVLELCCHLLMYFRSM
jgi:hypothetical protein